MTPTNSVRLTMTRIGGSGDHSKHAGEDQDCQTCSHQGKRGYANHEILAHGNVPRADYLTDRSPGSWKWRGLAPGRSSEDLALVLEFPAAEENLDPD